MNRFNRVILIVLDGVGVGAVEDFPFQTSSFRDVLQIEKDTKLPNLSKLGVNHYLNNNSENYKIEGYVSKCKLSSNFADSWAGHWELAGVTLDEQYSYYWEDGFQQEVIKHFEESTGLKVIGNKAFYHRNEVIYDYLQEHKDTPNSVIILTEKGLESIRTFGIYALMDKISLNEQYDICEIAANSLSRYNNIIGRIGCRPLIENVDGSIDVPHLNRKDFLMFNPPNKTLLKELSKANISTYAAGKVWAMFRGEAIKESIYTRSNDESVEALYNYMENVSSGLIFVNLNDFDAKYGHYFDTHGWAKAIELFDFQLKFVMSKMKADDLLIICSDGHGCDALYTGLHTREYSPLLIFHKNINNGRRLQKNYQLCDIAATIADNFNISYSLKGKSFLKEIFI
ncbi:phosphopentomutase [Robertmurraya siralis]|uniref:phosphopentomutase n=1 Tax=Robertmurraya siralis TaxID=77777 RepID=UPI000BA4F90E|nr:phosphopentomutase [Robertmurraya siralis]PAE18290.1 phosphopentomutase [Bacillus sp. 7504-2]